MGETIVCLALLGAAVFMMAAVGVAARLRGDATMLDVPELSDGADAAQPYDWLLAEFGWML